MKAASPTRKNVKWAEQEYQIFVTACETMIAEGHHRGKCFSKHGCERLVNLFNSSTAKNWSRTQLKNHWASMRWEHKHLHELLCSTGIEYNQRDNIIVADGDWWEQKIKKKAEYAKFRNRYVREIYLKYPLLFGQTFDSDKYAMTPTKLSQRGFDGVINSGSDNPMTRCPSSQRHETQAMKVRSHWDQVQEWISLVVTVEKNGKD
ncbi:L10-interacting MYB domain-containing protein-like [Abeliophyllum distichum]|uniref:L10-interacting MYB domain-containing protein-like n=1 Tax=Abeliophyllum distichum TaxID=126358 RepID=A0ABD1VZR4_9LAMI